MQQPERDVAIVVPCFNEEERLGVDRFRLFIASDKTTCLVFVDDGSTDGTADIIERIRSGHEHAVTLLRRSPNAGKGEAVRSGLAHALQGGFKYVGFFDADLATPLEAVSDFRAILDTHPEVAMVFGARVKLLGRKIERRAIRHYSGRVFATAVSLVLGSAIYDTQCGAKLFRATPELVRILEEPFLSRWIFDVEVLARLIRSRRRGGVEGIERCVHELPLWRWADVRGSKLHLSDFLVAGWDLVRIYRRYLR